LTPQAGEFIFGHGFYIIPLAAHRAADLLERFHDARVGFKTGGTSAGGAASL
jgi:hypothetical protein